MKGRPKKYAGKKRLVSASLSEKAAIILRLIRKNSPLFNLSEYLSACLVKDFEKKVEKETIMELMMTLEKRRDQEWKEIDEKYEHAILKLEKRLREVKKC